MNIKSNKGITLIALIVTVTVLAIFAYAVVSIGVSLTGTAKFTNVETYMLIIKSKSETMANEVAIGEREETELYGTLQSSGDLSGLYRLKEKEVKEMGIDKVKATTEDKIYTDYYIQYETNTEGEIIGVKDVIYEPGVENSGEMYYKLTEMVKADDEK